jgi:signal transduction histidine kinase/FixJ family two-component response regulator
MADISWLKSVLPGRISMKPNAAIAFLASGWTLRLLLRDSLSRWARAGSTALSLLVLAIGSVSLLESVLHAGLGIDQLLFVDRTQLSYPGRIAPISAINFCVAGIGLFLLGRRDKGGKLSHICAIFVLFSALLAVVAYLYGVPLPSGSQNPMSMALHSGVGFIVLGFAMLIAGPEIGILSLLSSGRPASLLSKKLLFAAVVLPFVLGLAVLRLPGFFGNTPLLLTILVVAQIIVFTVIIWISASRLDASEEEEELAKEALAASEQMLQQSQKMEAIGVLAGGLAHDFNNLLNVIMGYSELILKDAALPQTQRPKVEKIAKAGQTAAALTRQLLAFSRKQVLQPQTIDLNAIISNTDGYLPRLVKENIVVSTSLGPGLMATVIDPTQLEQILLNLVVNACDAMPEGGKLELETANVVIEEALASQAGVQPGNFIRLSISDTGTGMDAATQARIFEPFFTTKALGKGTGLGLATVYGIVKQSGGFIEVDSKPGRGTTFRVYLPASRLAPTPESQKTEQEQTRGRATVLVVEDSEPLRELVFETLESMGYTALVARDGQQAIRLCNGFVEKIDLLLTDVIMPKMNGPEVMKRIKELRPDIAVLFMSGYTNDVMLRHGVSKADVSFIQKPFSSAELMHKVREALVDAQERHTIRHRLSLAMSRQKDAISADEKE